MAERVNDMNFGSDPAGHSRTSSTSSTQSVFDNDFSDNDDKEEDQSFRETDEIDKPHEFSEEKDTKGGNVHSADILYNDEVTFHEASDEHFADTNEEGTRVSKSQKEVFETEPNATYFIPQNYERKSSDGELFDPLDKDVLVCEGTIPASENDDDYIHMDFEIELESSDDMDDFAASSLFDWEMPDDDLYETDQWENPYFSDKTVSQHTKVVERVIKALKVEKDTYPRIFHTRSNPGCGGVVTTAGSFRQMLLKLREKLKANKLLVHDVYPDGNCVFGAVIDQLRIQGEFRYTIHSLRLAAVEHLRNNPCSDDGTPYEMFLSGETWESYLTRMSLDGQWGDHIILSAIATVLSCRLMIYGGLSGDGETKIDPRIDKQPPDDEEVVSAQNDHPTLFLGHLGESHYISLRPENWKENLQDIINSNTEGRIMSEKSLEELSRKLLPIHCNSFLKSLFSLEYITSRCEDAIECMAPGREENDKFVFEMMGKLINKLEPCICEIESYMPELDAYFPDSAEKKPVRKKSDPTLILFCTPSDSRVVFNSKNANRLDLICEPLGSAQLGEMRLVPSNKKYWTKHLSELEGYLKTFEVGNQPLYSFPVLDNFLDIDISSIIAFQCRWPDEASDWISRQLSIGWLEETFLREIVTAGCHVIPVLAYKQLTDILSDFQSSNSVDGLTWRVSFAAAEKKIFQRISVSQRHCFQFLQLYLFNITQDSLLPDAIARSIFLHAVENTKDTLWEQQPASCFHKLLQQLAKGLESGVIPHFFVPKKNLLKSVSKEVAVDVCNKVKSYCSQPFVGLYFFLDQFDITTSEVGPFLDGIIEDIFKNDGIQKPEPFFYQVVLPSYASMLQTCTTHEDYSDAAQLVKNIKDEIHQFCGEDVPEATIIYSSMSGLHCGYRWMIALYMDLCNGSLITREIHGDRSTVNIREIFGPECTEELPDTLVDSYFKIENGDLLFALAVGKVLGKLGKQQAIAKCLRYYLDTLKDLAGDNLIISTYYSGSKSYSTGGLGSLFSLYVTLQNAYLAQHCVKDFKDMMPTLVKLTDRIGRSANYEQLSHIWTNLGEHDKARETASKMSATKRNINPMLQALTGVLNQTDGSYFDDY